MEGSYPYQAGAGSGGRGHYVPVYSECGRGAGGRGFHAAGTRCAGFGAFFGEYRENTVRSLLCVAQIESSEAVENAAAIAAVPGVDVLFVGPLDLSAGMDMPRQFSDPAFVETLRRVVAAASLHGKASGILVQTPEHIRLVRELGFRFIAAGGDSNAIRQAFSANLVLARA